MTQLAYIQDVIDIATAGGYIDFYPGGGKANTNQNWQNNCTRDLEEIRRRAQTAADKMNYAVVAKAEPDALLFLDDDGGIRALYEEKHGRLSATLKLSTPNGGSHYAFKHSAKSLAFHREINKAYISELKPEGTGELWSLRIHNSYVVGPGSEITKKDGSLGQYKIAYRAPIVEIPDSLLDFLIERWKATQTVQEQKPEHWMDAPINYGARNRTLFLIGSALRNAGLDDDGIYAVLSLKNQTQCDIPLDDADLKTITHSAGKYLPKAKMVLVGGLPAGLKPEKNPIEESAEDTLRNRAKEILIQTVNTIDSAPEPHIAVLNTIANLRQLDCFTPGFPQSLTKKSLYGLMGEFVDIAYPTTVASREMILYQALPVLGVVLGKRVYAPFGADRHYGVTWTLNIARTADGKGSVKNIILSSLKDIDEQLAKYGVKTNIASGEGLARVASGTNMVSPNPLTRLVWVMPEMAMLFNSMHRDGSILSHMLREAYDCNQLENEKSDKRKSYVATNYILGMMGTTSPAELRKAMPQIDWHNGVANRFLWNIGASTKKLNTSRRVPDFSKWAEKFKAILSLNSTLPEAQNIIDYSADGLDCWNAWVDGLPEEDEDSNLGLSQGRIKPNCLRAAVLYAQIDEERLDGAPLLIEPHHIEAGIEIVTRSADSTAYYLSGGSGKATGVSDGDIKRIYDAVATKARETGKAELSRAEITRMFRRLTDEQKDAVCLVANLHLEQRTTDGRSADVWCVNKG